MQELEFRVWLHDKGYMEVAHFDGGKWESDDGVFSLRVCEGDFIELCTGLKDKNGKKIYEGDIVKCGAYSGRPIVFEEGRYWLGEEPEDLFAGSLRSGVEVIGTIHENPELLEGEG